MTERAQSAKNTLYAGLFFGLVMGLWMAMTNGWLPPKSMGEFVAVAVTIAVAGSLFGLLIGLFMASPLIPSVEDMDLQPGETLQHAGLANHFLNLEGRGGRLALTNSHIIFQPHIANLQRSGLRIARSDIASVAPVKTLGVVPNGLAVTLKSGKTETFVVNGRAAWLAKLAAN
ncbi:MAG: hypothetical protein ACT4N2_09905 [Hyphomicrobium sp.]